MRLRQDRGERDETVTNQPHDRPTELFFHGLAVFHGNLDIDPWLFSWTGPEPTAEGTLLPPTINHHSFSFAVAHRKRCLIRSKG